MGFEPLGGVLEHHRVIRSGQGAVGVFREVLVARGIEQVDRAAGVVELQHRGGNRNTPLLLELHPVGGHLALLALGLYGTGLLNGAPIKKKLFGEGCFTGVGVRNNGKVAAPAHGGGQLGQLWGCTALGAR